MDSLCPEERSELMSKIRSKDTKLELFVRRMVHGMGFRYSLHKADLPGKPDMTFISRRKIIFVHGCFWHRHSNCNLARLPKSRLDFWEHKLESNRKRDLRNIELLELMGWDVRIVWECETSKPEALRKELYVFLNKETLVGHDGHDEKRV